MHIRADKEVLVTQDLKTDQNNDLYAKKAKAAEALLEFKEEQKAELNHTLDIQEGRIDVLNGQVMDCNEKIAAYRKFADLVIAPELAATWQEYNVAKRNANDYKSGEEGYTDAQAAKSKAYKQYTFTIGKRTSNSIDENFALSSRRDHVFDIIKIRQYINFARRFIDTILNKNNFI